MFSDPFAQLQAATNALADLRAARQTAEDFLAADTSTADLAELSASIETAIEKVKAIG